jgi:hypothetical protein
VRSLFELTSGSATGSALVVPVVATFDAFLLEWKVIFAFDSIDSIGRHRQLNQAAMSFDISLWVFWAG